MVHECNEGCDKGVTEPKRRLLVVKNEKEGEDQLKRKTQLRVTP